MMPHLPAIGHRRVLTVVITLLGFFLASVSTASACTLITAGNHPDGWGAAHNLFSSAGELILGADCTIDAFTPEAGSSLTDETNFAVYSTGYYYGGSEWEPITYTPVDGAAQYGPWILGDAAADAGIAYQDTNTFFATYTCHWDGSDWNCGCQDEACDTPSWQLQAVRDPNVPDDPSTGPGGGGGADSLFNDDICTAGLPVIEVTPGESIDAAVDDAPCGSVVAVRAGTYTETISLSGKECSASEPLLIVSADGPGAATIRMPETSCRNDGFKPRGSSYFGLYDFTFAMNNTGESGCFASGFNSSSRNSSSNFVIAGNTYTGFGDDVIKVAGDASSVAVVGNTLEGEAMESGLDVVGVQDLVFAYNDVRGDTRVQTLGKDGSSNAEIYRNNFAPTRTFFNICIGGTGRSREFRLEDGGAGVRPDGYEASQYRVYDNVIEGRVCFKGGQNSVLENNYIDGSVREERSGSRPYSFESFDNVIRNNVIAGSVSSRGDSGDGTVVENNTRSGNRPAVGPSAMPRSSLYVCPQ